jgi:hypothetical protein
VAVRTVKVAPRLKPLPESVSLTPLPEIAIAREVCRPSRDVALRLQKFTRHPALKGLLLLGLPENHAFLVAELDGPAARDIGPSERP